MKINKIKILVAIPVMLTLCFSFIQTKAFAIDKVKNDSSIVAINNNESSSENKSTTITEKNNQQDNEQSNDASKENNNNTLQNEQNIKTGPNVVGPSPADVNIENNKNPNNNEETVNQEEALPSWKTINGKLYYVTKKGVAEKTGWFKEKYIQEDVTDKDDILSNDNEYYLDKDHSATIGWKKIDGNWYFFNEKGIKQKSWILNDYSWFHLDDNGIMEKGWIKDQGYRYYLNDEGKITVGKKFIDGDWYFFDGSGRLQTGIYDENGKEYYSTKDGVMVTNEWVNIGEKNYYIKADSSIAIGDIIIDGQAHRFDKNGDYIGTADFKDSLFLKFVNVGDADCGYVKLPNGETVLIDTGDVKSSDTLINFLNEQNLKTKNGKGVIDYVIITHPHSDHIGGLKSVIENFKVKKIYMPKIAEMKDWYSDADEKKEKAESIELLKSEYEIYKETMDLIEENDIKVKNTEKDKFIDSDNILKFIQSDKDFGPIGSEKLLQEYWALNDKSAIVYLNYADLQVLFTGDIEWTAEKDFVNNKLLNDGQVDILKVPHHGHNTSSTIDFVQYVKSKLGVISRSKESINTETLKNESVSGNNAYKNLISTGVSVYETSQKDGVSVYATKDNWNLEN